MDFKAIVIFFAAVYLPKCWVVKPDCRLGTILEYTPDGGYKCTQCLNGTFNSVRNKDRCELCTTVHPGHLSFEVVSPCRYDRDTQLRCRRQNYFFDLIRKTCWPCSRCDATKPFVAQACSGTKNTVCCEREGMVIRDGICAEPDFCSVRERLISRGEVHERYTICEQCPENYTNYENKHSKKTCTDQCIDINSALSKNSQVVLERNITCREDEDLLGRSCYKNETVVCRPIQGSSHTYRTDYSDTFNKSTSRKPYHQNEYSDEDLTYSTKEELPKKNPLYTESWFLGVVIALAIMVVVIAFIVGVIYLRHSQISSSNEY